MKAKAAQDGTGTVGIGASITFNLVNNDVFSGFDLVSNPANGPPVTGVRDIKLTSSNADSVTSEAEGGGAGGGVTIARQSRCRS